jgi:hypothetical protein
VPAAGHGRQSGLLQGPEGVIDRRGARRRRLLRPQSLTGLDRTHRQRIRQRDALARARPQPRASQSGQREKAAAAAARREDSSAGTYNLACYHALAGQRADAIRYLRKAVDLGHADMAIRDDPDFASLRGDPEFEEIIADVKHRIGAN